MHLCLSLHGHILCCKAIIFETLRRQGSLVVDSVLAASKANRTQRNKQVRSSLKDLQQAECNTLLLGIPKTFVEHGKDS